MPSPFTAPLQASTVYRQLPRVRARLSSARAPSTTRHAPFRIAGTVVGALRSNAVEHLRAWPRVFLIDASGVAMSPQFSDCDSRSAALAGVTRALAAAGLLPGWRDELYRIATAFDAPPLARIERAAARLFGIHTWAAHANGLVAGAGHPRMWLARRSATKPIDPGLLDNLVGGGIPAAASIVDTLHKECWEEAGIDSGLAHGAQSAGSVEIRRDHPEGPQLETVFMHDLWLPAGFVPVNQDGEAVEHRLCDLEEVFALIAEPDTVTLDASLVALDCILRLGALDDYPEAHGELTALLAATRA